MYAITYLEINSFCILLLLIILKCHLENLNKGLSGRIFRNLLVTVIVYIMFDILCGLNDNDAVSYSRSMAVFINVGFYYSSYLISYLCFMFAECELGATWVYEKRKRRLYAIPTVLLFVLTALTLKWKFFFYIDEAGNYIKGPLYFPMLLLVYGHLIAIGVKALIMLPQKRYYVHRAKLTALSSFVFFPLLAGAVQAFFNGISIICMGCTIAAIQVFISMQKTQITIDPLTELNNRGKMMQHLERCINQVKNGSPWHLYLLLLDIDRFKQINDNYGHLEGDRALIRLANVLKKAAAKETCLIARYGGDEFAIVLETLEGTGDDFAERVQSLLQEDNERTSSPYSLEISIGSARFSPRFDSIQDFIRQADKELYLEKALKKQKVIPY